LSDPTVCIPSKVNVTTRQHHGGGVLPSPATNSRQISVFFLEKHGTETRNPDPEARNPEPGTRNPEPESRIPNLESRIPNPESRIGRIGRIGRSGD